MKNIKEIILERVIEEVIAQIGNSARGLESALEDAKCHRGKLESRYDTFLEEAQYLASGHARQLAELNQQLSSLRNLRGNIPVLTRVATCALVEVEDLDDKSITLYLLLPTGGGETYEIDQKHFVVISGGSVVASALRGYGVGDEVTVRLPNTTKRLAIVSIT